MRKLIVCILIVLTVFISGCTNEKDSRIENVNTRNWEKLLESSKGTKVNLYTYIDKEDFINYIDKYIKPRLKTEYDISLKLIVEEYEDIIYKLKEYKESENENGEIDIIWIEGDKINELTSKEYIFKPFTDELPSKDIYLDLNKYENTMYLGNDLKNAFLPFGRSQMVMYYNENAIDEGFPSTEELFDYVKKNPGRFTYPEAKSQLGQDFVNTVIMNEVSLREIMKLDGSESTDEIKKVIQPGIDMLIDINPYLWNDGKSYPMDERELIDLYNSESLDIGLSRNQFYVQNNDYDDFPGDTFTFVFDKGTVNEYTYLCIPYNSTNKSGAMVVCDYLLTPDSQVIKYNPSNWGNLPVVDSSRLNDIEFNKFKKVRLKKYSLDYSELYTKSLPTLSDKLSDKIREIWYQEVYTK